MKKMQKNPLLAKTIIEIEQHAKKSKSAFWARVGAELKKPLKNQRTINVSKVSSFSQKDDTVLVAGKVLGVGAISHPVTIIAYAWSDSAAQKVKAAGGSIISLSEGVKKHPKGSKVVMLG